MPGTAAGTPKEAVHGGLGDPLGGRLLRAALARDDHVRLQQVPWRSMRCVEPVEGLVQRARRDLVARLDRVVAVHQHLGLDDRNKIPLLAERRVARQRMRVGAEAVVGGDAVADRDHRAPLGEARAEGGVLLEPRAQAVEPLGDLLARVGQRIVGARVDLDPWDDALVREQLGNGVPSSARWRIVSS